MSGLFPAEEAHAMADRLIEHFFNLTPAQRVLAGIEPVQDSARIKVESAVAELMKNVPLQYVIGKAWFMDMEFDVNRSVLIPRPETEEMVSLILKDLANRAVQPMRILDVGTGSGCIAVSIKKNSPESELLAIDISQEALQVAKANATKNNVDVTFLRIDILDTESWSDLPEFDLIVSNPPYVTESEKKLMLPNVLDYEPHKALFVADEDPLVFYQAIMLFAKSKLRKKGHLWFEINEKFGLQMKELAFYQGFREANIIFDFRIKSRFLHCF